MSATGGVPHEIRCEHCSSSFPDRVLYEQHFQICPNASVLCPFHPFGCQTKVARDNLRNHILSSLDEHLQSYNNLSSEKTSDMTSVQTQLDKQAQEIKELRAEQKVLQSILFKREQQLTRACVGVELLKGEFCDLKKSVETSQTLIHNDGTYLWHITNLSELFRNAKNSTQPSYVTSSAFYTSKYGYKLSLRVYLNGDKLTRDTYLSLYITVMEGEYDSLLKWPFTYPITLCLYDRSKNHDHVVHTITPDTTSACFERPTRPENRSAGIPEFCPLWKVYSKEFGYVRQDQMFIKAFVDFNTYPTNIWPDWTQLQANGLPIHVEHMKLDEIIKQKE